MADNAEIKGLEFKVEGSVDNSLDKLDALASTLKKIQSATKGGLGLKRAINELKQFEKDMPNFKGKAFDWSDFVSSVEKNIGGIKAVTKGGIGLKRVAKEMLLFGEVSSNEDVFDNLARGTFRLQKLSKPLSETFKTLKESTDGKLGLSKFGRQLATFSESLKSIESSDMDKMSKVVATLNVLAKPLADVYSKLSEATQGKVTGLGTFGKQLGQFISSMKDFTPSDVQNFEALAKGIDTLIPSLARMRSAVGENASDLGNIFRGLKDYNKAVDRIQKARDSAKDSRTGRDVEGGTDIAQVTKQMNMWQRVMSELRNNSEGLKEQMASNLASMFERAASSVGRFIGRLKTSAVKAFSSAIRSLGSHLKGLLPNFDFLGNAIHGLTGRLKGLWTSLLRIAKFRVMRTIIKGITSAMKEGTHNLYAYSQAMGTTFHNSLDQISTDALYLKNSFAAAAAPLINALAPAIDYLANKIANLLNLIAQLFAALSGQAFYSKAIKQTKQFGDSTGSAAKEMRYLIAGFDELNVLPSQNGGGGGGTDFSGMFEEAPVSKAIKDYVKRIKDAIKAGDWEGVGAIIAEGINKAVGKVDDWIVGKFTPKAKTWASRIGRILNGFIDKLDWAKIGRTLAHGVNGVFGALETFFDTFKAKKFGRKIGTLIKSFFDETDWAMVGRTFAKKWNTLMHTIEGIVTTPGMWTSIGSAIGEFVKSWVTSIDFDSLATIVISTINGVKDAIKAFLSKDPFKGLGKKIGDAINRVIHEIDWADLAKTLSDLFLSFLNVLWEAADTIDWEGLGKAIGEFLGNIKWGEILGKVADIVFKAFTGVIKGLLSTDGGRIFLALFTAIKGLKLAFTLARPILREASKLIAKDIVENFDQIPGKIKGIGSKIGTSIKGLMGTQITSGVGAGGVAASAGAGAVAGVAGVALGMEMADIIQPGSKEQFIDAFNDTYSADSLWGNIQIWAEEWGNIFSNLWNNMITEVTTNWEAFTQRIGIIGDWFADIGQLIAEKFTNFTSQVGEFFTGVWLKVSGFFSTVATSVANWFVKAWSDVSNWITTAINNIGTFFSNLWTDISTWFSNTASSIGTWFKNAWTNVGNWFSTAISDVGTWFKTIWTNVSAWFETTASNIGSWFKTSWDNVTTWFTTAISDVGTWFKNIWTDVSTWFNNTATNVGTWFKNAWTAVGNWFKTAIQDVGTFFSNIWNDITGFFSGTENEGDKFGKTMEGNAGGLFKNLGTSLGTWISDTWTSLSEWFGSLPSKIGDFFKDAGSWLWNAGKNIIEGLWNGIKEVWNNLTSWISEAAQSVGDTFKKVLKIASPSKVMTEIGQYVMVGFENGMVGEQNRLLAQASAISNKVTTKLTPSLGKGNDAYSMQQKLLAMQNQSAMMETSANEAAVIGVLQDIFAFMQTNMTDTNDTPDVKVMIDGREVFNAVVNENNRAIRRSGGVSPLRV